MLAKPTDTAVERMARILGEGTIPSVTWNTSDL